MSHLSSVFNKVPVKVPNRSGFDMSHENLFTATVGTLIPASVEEVMPGDIVSVGSALSVELPPLATNFKGRVDAKLEAFFVPNRLLWAGWQDFITQDANSVLAGSTGVTGGSGVTVPSYSVPYSVPQVQLNYSRAGNGTLADYLGVKTQGSTTTTTVNVSALPFLAYQKIWDDWYRDSNIQQPFFIDGFMSSTAAIGSQPRAAYLPYTNFSGVLNSTSSWGVVGSLAGYNGRYLTSLAQRNFAKDYFTTMTYEPQAGAGASLQFSVDSGNSTAGFTIAQLRTANSLQKWLERNNIAGTRYYDQILAHYGVLPPDANVQRAILLGSMTTPVIVNSLSQTNSNSSQTDNAKNPYSMSTGAQFGKGTSFGKDRLIDNFEVKEHGYIFILFSLVPHAYYGTGSRRYITKHIKSSDFAFPEFANIGDQAVYKSELSSSWSTDFNGAATDTVLGYNQRYSEYKYHDDEVHGLLQDNQSLESFVLQRGFDTGVTLGSDLLAIPIDYMDNVMVTTQGVSGFNAVVDAYFDSKILRTLPEYSLPSL